MIFNLLTFKMFPRRLNFNFRDDVGTSLLAYPPTNRSAALPCSGVTARTPCDSTGSRGLTCHDGQADRCHVRFVTAVVLMMEPVHHRACLPDHQ